MSVEVIREERSVVPAAARSTGEGAPFLALPPGTMSPGGLGRLTAHLAGETVAGVGADLRLDPGERTWRLLHRDDDVDVWLIAWAEGSDTGWHDHDTSAGAFHVVEGAVTERRPDPAGGSPQVRRFEGGQGTHFGPEHVHRIVGAAARSITVHAYSPPLRRMGRWSTAADGTLVRAGVAGVDDGGRRTTS